jgi:hypothetical protein
MIAEVFTGIIIFFMLFLVIIIVGSKLFTIRVNDQIRYLSLIIFYAPLPAINSIPSNPKPGTRYLSWALGNNRDPFGEIHIRYAGRIRYGKTNRGMKMTGEAFFSLATPGFVEHTKIACSPGIWPDAFDYYVHDEAGMNLYLFSFFPLNISHNDEIKTASLFRYLASTPIFPAIYGAPGFIKWENVDDSTAKAIIHHSDQSVEAMARFNSQGWIEQIALCRKIRPEISGRPGPGLFTSRFSSYEWVGGFRIPIQIVSDLNLPGRGYACAEYTITSIEVAMPAMMCGARA